MASGLGPEKIMSELKSGKPVSRTPPPLKSATASPPQPEVIVSRKVPFLASGLTLLGAFPLLLWHVLGMLGQEHYQYILFVPVGAWLLTIGQEPMRLRVGRPLATPALFLSGLGLLILYLAARAWSPWLGTVATLISAVPCL